MRHFPLKVKQFSEEGAQPPPQTPPPLAPLDLPLSNCFRRSCKRINMTSISTLWIQTSWYWHPGDGVPLPSRCLLVSALCSLQYFSHCWLH